jgi:hypothetical protein
MKNKSKKQEQTQDSRLSQHSKPKAEGEKSYRKDSKEETPSWDQPESGTRR